jgi:hypothetical protein
MNENDAGDAMVTSVNFVWRKCIIAVKSPPLSVF